ncbi:hypothetical protein HDZ31DRAFT_36187 [Schizophyllum fasciatum]
MKRGFLNSKKGKAAIASDAPSVSPTQDSSGPGDKEGPSCETSAFANTRKDHILASSDAPLSTIEESPADRLDFDAKSLVFTTIPTQSEDVAAHTPAERRDSWTEAIVDGQTKKAIFSQRGFPQPVRYPTSPCHRIGPAEGSKGQGIFATRNIKPGELILAERPLALVPRVLIFGDPASPTAAPDPTVTEAHLEFLSQRLLVERREALLRLVAQPALENLRPISARLTVNVFPINGYRFGEMEGSQGRYVAAYENISRINHDCRPNAHYAFHRPSFSARLRALRHIKAGEEILISYVPPEAPRSQRQEGLSQYGFTCTCVTCEEGEEADKRRAGITQPIDEEDSKRTKQQEFDRISRQIAMLENEGLAGVSVYMNNILYGIRLAAGVGEWDKCGSYNEKMAAMMPLSTDEMGDEAAEQLAFLGL